MTTLVLIRHAKSDWGSPTLDDHDRPLNARGRRDAPVMAERLRGRGTPLDAVVASTALRARTTAGVFAEAYGLEPVLRDELYGAPAAVLLRAAATSGAANVAVVAHDPGISVLAERLSGGGIGHMPTCAVATFTWDEDDWHVASALDPNAWDLDTPR